MKNKTKKTITVETRTQTVIRRSGQKFVLRCEKCGAETEATPRRESVADNLPQLSTESRSKTLSVCCEPFEK